MAELKIEQDTLRDTVTINGVRYPRALFEDIAAVPTGDRVLRAFFGPDGASVQEVDRIADAQDHTIKTAPLDRDVLVFNDMYGWYRSRATVINGQTHWPLFGLLGRVGGVWYPVPSRWMNLPPTPEGRKWLGTSTMPQFPEDAQAPLLTFEEWWEDHGKHNAAWTAPHAPAELERRKELMKLSWDVAIADGRRRSDPPSGTPSDWVDANVSGNPTLMQAMKNFAENGTEHDRTNKENNSG